MAPVLAELMGRECGLMAGKGGSMHLTSVEHGMMGSYAIVGAHLPIAAGAAWSAQYRGTDQVAVCFFGDGTTNIGAFHEALNLAAVWKLPVVFVCENNLYMEYTPIAAVTAVEHPAADRASAYGLAPMVVDGNDAGRCVLAARGAFEKRAPGRRGAVADRSPDLPARRPLARRSRRNTGRRANWKSGSSAIPSSCTGAGCSSPALPRRPWKRSRTSRCAKSMKRPKSRRHRRRPGLGIETNVWANGGAAWRN